ncbi:MAG TPA: 16S rRNA (guanine(966)-N(2))-methyltransferase RsmD [Blastocatellia bacterium]|nr:16S rRNA (guanine(966)-N(2))-methyltransferase RsmD [Blastocatellia bacterium]
MRVISGIYKGRRLKAVEGTLVRPTSDRLRETLFNVLSSGVEGARFVDICAGTGAVGIEALSRGAAHVTFIESNRRAAQVLSENLAHCGITENVKVINRDAISTLKYFSQHLLQFDYFYLDPPYDSELYSQVLWTLAKSRLIAEEGLVIVEHRKNYDLQPNYDFLRPYRQIIQGDSCLTLYSMERGIA